MSVREFPADDSTSRQERAEQTTINDVRTISGDGFGFPSGMTIYEVDLVNEEGETRENVTIIPSILFENTKDVQYRHDEGIVGKYTRALAMQNEQAHTELMDALAERRGEVRERIEELEDIDTRLLHTEADLGGL